MHIIKNIWTKPALHLAKCFGRGDFTLLVGKSGVELAYYQWRTALTFEEIEQFAPVINVYAMYSPYHEMDIQHFVDKMNELYKIARPETNLKWMRMKAGFSQRELAELSGVPLRTIQQYEQRQKNINKAQVEYLLMLAQALCCKVEDLVE